MKLGAIIPVLNEWRFLPAVAGQLFKIVDHIIILRNTISQSRAPVKFGPVPQLDSRIKIIQGTWDDEAIQRNFGINYLCNDLKCDYVLTIDSDEIFLDNDLLALQSVCNTNIHKAIGGRLWTYWKTPEYRIDPPEGIVPCIAVKKNVHFLHHRALNEYLFQSNIWFHHLSYVRTNDDLKEKLRIFGHSTEVLPDWYKKIWKRWDKNKEMLDLHPTHPACYKQAIYAPNKELNEILKKFGCK